MDYQGNAKHLVDQSTAAARMFGADVASALDVLQVAANGCTSAGLALAAAGVTEEAVIRWRRPRQEPALLTLTRSNADSAVDAALTVVNARGAETLVAPIPQYIAMVTALLVQTGDDPQFTALLEHLDVNRKRLGRKLTSSPVRSSALPRDTRPRLSVWEREGRLVFEPERLATLGAEGVRTGAIVASADTSQADLGALTLDGLSRFGSLDDPGAGPFWTLFGERTLEGFTRRARLVLIHSNDYSVSLTATIHTRRVDYPIRTDRTRGRRRSMRHRCRARRGHEREWRLTCCVS